MGLGRGYLAGLEDNLALTGWVQGNTGGAVRENTPVLEPKTPLYLHREKALPSVFDKTVVFGVLFGADGRFLAAPSHTHLKGLVSVLEKTPRRNRNRNYI